ncbi:MAG: hypothetical protein ACYTF1_09400 [Planctomycetota bacterium]|jgi:hypothetical protein
MRKKHHQVLEWILTLSAVLSLSLGSILMAEPNGDFDTDYIYCRQNDKIDQWPRYHGSIKVFDEVTGQQIKLIQPQGADWGSLTFSGTGSNDARLFVAKTTGTDVLIAELDGPCTVTDPLDPSQCPPTNSVLLSTLLGSSPGADILAESIRYSIYHNSLFIGINPNQDTNPDPATIYEVNLALDTLLNTYTAGNISDDWGVYIDINGHNGDLYVLQNTLVSANGGLVKVDTVDPGKGTVTTLIDGSTAGGRWVTYGPRGLAYRNNNNIEVAQTVVIPFITQDITGEYVEEYYLEQTDGSGNLLKRKDAYKVRRQPGYGQLDEYNGNVILVRAWPASVAGNAGVDQYTPEDGNYRAPFNSAINNILYNNGFYDVDSPGFRPTIVIPISEQNSVAYTGLPADPSSIEYKVINKGYSGDISYTVVESPDAPWLTLDKTSGGPIPPASGDTVTATIDTSTLSSGIYTTDLIFTDDSASVNQFTRTITLTVKDCDWAITPDSTNSRVPGDITVWGNCTSPQDYQFTVSNLAGANLNYTVEEIDGPDPATANPTDYTWLDLDKTSGGPVPAGSYDTLTITVTSDNTVKEAYLRFNPSCGGIPAEVRKIEVTNYTEVSFGEDKSFKHAYLGDVDPLLVDSCGYIPPDTTTVDPGKCTFVLHTDVGSIVEPNGTVVDDPDAQNGKAFYTNNLVHGDPDNQGRHGYKSYTTDNGGAVVRNFLASRLGFTMVARLKVIQNQNTGAVIWTWSKQRDGYPTPKSGWNITWHGGGLGALGRLREYQFTNLPPEDVVSDQLDTNPEASEYHIFRVVNGFGHYGERIYKVYYDEDPNPVFVIEDPPATTNGAGDDGFCFGTFGQSAAGEVYWDWISFTNKGMYAPGEENDCIGSLIPAFAQVCDKIPFADADGDGDVDQDDFAIFQQCYSGEGNAYPATPEYCQCFNRDADTDVDTVDFGEFQNCASGPNIPVTPASNPSCNFNP